MLVGRYFHLQSTLVYDIYAIPTVNAWYMTCMRSVQPMAAVYDVCDPYSQCVYMTWYMIFTVNICI